MAIEVDSAKSICGRCGINYSRWRGYFPTSYASLHKGVRHTPICKDCIEALYEDYFAKCNDAKFAVRQMCRKLDLYWNENIFNQIAKKTTTRSIMSGYIQRTTSNTYAGKCYDDTLLEEGTLWNYTLTQSGGAQNAETADNTSNSRLENFGITEDVVAFWGPGYTPEMLVDLEQRRLYWMSKFPKEADIDIGAEAIIRQLCSLELDINRDRAAGRPVDKNINTLNTLLKSACLQPTQKKDDADSSLESTPFGVWIRRWENKRPIPEVDPELEDVDGIIRYISIWFLGHLCKMLGIKNTYCKLYEDELAKMRIERPEYDDEDDETMFNDIFGSNDDTDGSSETGGDG